MTHGETSSKSILEEQQTRSRMSSVLFVVSRGGGRSQSEHMRTVHGPTRAKFIHGEAALLRQN